MITRSRMILSVQIQEYQITIYTKRRLPDDIFQPDCTLTHHWTEYFASAKSWTSSTSQFPQLVFNCWKCCPKLANEPIHKPHTLTSNTIPSWWALSWFSVIPRHPANNYITWSLHRVAFSTGTMLKHISDQTVSPLHNSFSLKCPQLSQSWVKWTTYAIRNLFCVNASWNFCCGYYYWCKWQTKDELLVFVIKQTIINEVCSLWQDRQSSWR